MKDAFARLSAALIADRYRLKVNSFKGSGSLTALKRRVQRL